MASVWNFLMDSIKGDMLTIFNWMFSDVRIIEQQEHGIVLCITNSDIFTTPAEYTQFTVMNTEYKILAPVRKHRLKPTLCLLHHSQYFGVPNTTIFEALKTVPDSIMYSYLTHSPLCNLTWDFTAEFDRISYTYLFLMLNVLSVA